MTQLLNYWVYLEPSLADTNFQVIFEANPPKMGTGEIWSLPWLKDVGGKKHEFARATAQIFQNPIPWEFFLVDSQFLVEPLLPGLALDFL